MRQGMFYCSGFQGQMVAIIPSLDLVIVRMGLKEDPDFDFNGFERVIGSLKR
jgi:CubicO group peptidase (beta-lactamase class C family)